MSARFGQAVGRLRSLVQGRRAGSDVVRDDAVETDRITERPQGIVLWVLADDGVAAAPSPVIADELAVLIEEDVHVVVTAPRAQAELPRSVARRVHVADVPAENDRSAATFLNHWKPDFGLVIGMPEASNILNAAAARDLPLYHASASRTHRGARRFPAYFDTFRVCLASSAAEANGMKQKFRHKGPAIEITGPLTDTVRALPCNDAECDDLAKLLGGRPVWLAAQIEDDEISMIENAHRKAFRSAHRLLLVLVPRDASAGIRIVETLETQGWRTGLRSRSDEPDPDVQIYVADTEDELGLWYRLAPSTFIGGTFLPYGSAADPFDAASLGSAVLHGPHVGATPSRFQRLEANGASVRVSDAEELGEAIITLLAPDKAAMLAQAGWATTTESAHVVQRLAELMQAERETQRETV